ncbi:hypothetical protein [Streptomyces nigra]|uniref:hypothetical protein n=1 Tax=Streptomyces nigra TaxID=1827580 RepID=UPI003810395B
MSPAWTPSRWSSSDAARASRALVAEAEKAAGSHQAGKLGAAVMYATHEPELTDFYAGLGFTLSPDGIPTPTA